MKINAFTPLIICLITFTWHIIRLLRYYFYPSPHIHTLHVITKVWKYKFLRLINYSYKHSTLVSPQKYHHKYKDTMIFYTSIVVVNCYCCCYHYYYYFLMFLVSIVVKETKYSF